MTTRHLLPAALLSAIIIILVSACAPGKRRPAGLPDRGARERPVPVEDGAPPPAQEIAVLWRPAAGEDLITGATFFHMRPQLKVTAVLSPPAFEQTDAERVAWQSLSTLVTHAQMEIVLTLPGQPPLALIQNTDIAKNSKGDALSLPPAFSWPEDVLGHLVLARSEFRRRWRQNPTALVMPGGLVGGPEIVALERVGLKWMLLLDGEGQAGCFSGLPVSVVRPVSLRGERDALADWKSAAAVSVPPPPIVVRTLADLQTLEKETQLQGISWKTVSEVLAGAGDLPVWPGLDQEKPDFSPWIGEAEENAAWRLLSLTRQAIEDYKNSGEANVRSLDVAQREIYQAESGKYFLAFGTDHETSRDSELKQEFMATLAQTYRLMGKPVPSYLLEDFSGSQTGPGEVETTTDTFQRGSNSWRWFDPPRDDRGPGHYYYPVGSEFVPGAWDLVAFEVRLSQSNVSFYFEMASLSNPWKAPYGFSLPLVDVYLDINQLPGAGSERLLSGRPGIVESRNAWEYALTVDGWGARFFQYNPRLAARRLETLPVKVVANGAGFRVDVPRRHFRGNPERWGYSVVIMGLDPDTTPRTVDPMDDRQISKPMAVAAEPETRRFGGAWEGTAHAGSGREAPPFLDILVPSGASQSQVLGVYRQGRDVVLPFVRPTQ